MSARVLVVGELAVEDRCVTALVAAPRRVEVAVRRARCAGGAGGLGAVAAADTGAHVLAVGLVGSDDAAALVLRALHRAGVDTAAVARVEGGVTAQIVCSATELGYVGDRESTRAGGTGIDAPESLVPPDALDAFAACGGAHVCDAATDPVPNDEEDGSTRLHLPFFAPTAPGPEAGSTGWPSHVASVERGEPGDVLLVDGPTLQHDERLLDLAWERDLQIIADLTGYWPTDGLTARLLPGLARVDAVVVDAGQGAGLLSQQVHPPGSTLVLDDRRGSSGASWDDLIAVAPAAEVVVSSRYAARHVFCGALAGALALGEDRPEALDLALAAWAGAAAADEPFPGARLDGSGR